MCQSDVVKLLRKKDGQTSEELLKKLKINTSSLGRNLKKLKDNGEVFAKEVRLDGFWRFKYYLLE